MCRLTLRVMEVVGGLLYPQSLAPLNNCSSRFLGIVGKTIDWRPSTFAVERWGYLGGIEDWNNVDYGNDLEKLAQKTIPLLGNDAFYGLLY